ncbi:hypothetical protein OJF2_34720 [Aquisphaera giovannonii]|uniref:Lipoprotein n=1 Tax=Aquisphaera giovannonii TaxID=406548 RepID=A0A5B9W3V8_9BACT|nr:hypothetical protein [Aquisphaera giovannonii]QEH34927.1 hypothetical protein OJF2_34720 [Aquisphaera giovannonii]
MLKSRTPLVYAFPVLLGSLLPLAGCQEGPAERAGKQVDNAAKDVRDTVNPPKGPVEAAGRKIDDATHGNP